MHTHTHTSATMCLSLALVLLNLLGLVQSVLYQANINMAGVKGTVMFNSSLKVASVNISGACDTVNVSITEFPVMYGHFYQPCQEASIGAKVYTFTASRGNFTVNVAQLFEERTYLDDLSVLLETCNKTKVCGNLRQNGTTRTWQARFFDPVAGDMYIRQNVGGSSSRLLSSLISLQGRPAVTSATVYVSQSSASSCQELLGNINPSSLLPLGNVTVGSSVQPVRSRRDLSNFSGSQRFIVLKVKEAYLCSKVRVLEEKVVQALIDMKGAKGVLSFSQLSPFDVTEISINLTNLRSMVGPYHVHQFPVPQKKSSMEDVCSNDNVGGHWNPFKVDVNDPSYPKTPGATHDKYEIGDLSGKHGSLDNADRFEASYLDWGLPLFGRNSIVGRSVVIHKPNTSRHLCGSIGYSGDVVVAKSVFRSPVVGTIYFTQPSSNPYADVTVYADLAYGMPSTPASTRHSWHIHEFPISTETDSDTARCESTGWHWNPSNVNARDNNYTLFCQPNNPFACEVGDLTGKHQSFNLTPAVGKFEGKHFFTDTTSWAMGTESLLGKSVVIHAANGNPSRLACANITVKRLTSAQTSTWFGAGTAQGRVQFSEISNSLTVINVSLWNLNSKAGGFHVHVLPIDGKGNPCSDDNVMGHFNPLGINQSASPPPSSGSADQYEIGDISGKFGLLTSLNQSQKRYTDNNMPMSGPNSIVGRSLVIHYRNGSRMQCANIVADNASDGRWVRAGALFRGAVSGNITLSQQSFQDGSHGDVTLEVDIRATAEVGVTVASWSIHSGHLNDTQCSALGERFNPFNMSAESSSCSYAHPLNCEVGDLTARHGPVNLTLRQLFTDSTLQLTGDFTVLHRFIVLRSGKGILACANILPLSPSANLIFPKVTSFSRFDFRTRVASSLDVGRWRITILPGELSPEAGGKCQQVSFLVAGDVSTEALNSVKDNEKMGPFRQSRTCSQSGGSGTVLGPGQLLFMLAGIQLLLWVI